MYCIKLLFPKFKHNDLHTDNILLKFDRDFKYRADSPSFLIYNVTGVDFAVPYYGIVPKIIDFGYSEIPEMDAVSNITLDKIQMYYRSDNDVLFLFHWIYAVAVQEGLYRVEELLGNLEPNKSYVQHYTEHIRKIAPNIPTYLDMVLNKEFFSYRDPSRDILVHQRFNPIEDILLD